MNNEPNEQPIGADTLVLFVGGCRDGERYHVSLDKTAVNVAVRMKPRVPQADESDPPPADPEEFSSPETYYRLTIGSFRVFRSASLNPAEVIERLADSYPTGTIEQIKAAHKAGATVELATIDQSCSVVAWTEIEPDHEFAFPPSRYRYQTGEPDQESHEVSSLPDPEVAQRAGQPPIGVPAVLAAAAAITDREPRSPHYVATGEPDPEAAGEPVKGPATTPPKRRRKDKLSRRQRRKTKKGQRSKR